MITSLYKFNESKSIQYKTIEEFLSYYYELKSNSILFVLDTETTGLGGPKKQQLTQIASLAYLNDEIVGKFNEKLKLTDKIKKRISEEPEGKWSTRKILSFNRYGDPIGKSYIDVEIGKNKFINWVDKISLDYNKRPVFVIQNAEFDMSMFDRNLKYKVLDTKSIIRLYLIPLFEKLSETNNKYKDILEKEIGTSDRDFGLYNSSMSKWGPYFKLNMSGYHDAYEDCKITFNMLEKIILLLEENKNIDIMEYQVKRIKTLKNKN